VIPGSSAFEAVNGIEVALHSLCQPLTVLHCRLELGLMSGEPEAMRQALVEGIRECVRSNQAVAQMRELVVQAMGLEEIG
jgi:hypothetical protein